jgi:hypothetical protein
MNVLINYLESAFFYLISASSFELFTTLALFGIIFLLRDWKTYFALLLALCVGSICGLILMQTDLLNFSANTRKLLLYSAILMMGVHHISTHSINSNVFRYNFFALIGLILGISLSSHYGNDNSFSLIKFTGYNLGVSAAYFVISFCSILISTLVLLVFKTDKRSYNLTLSGIGIGMALILLYLRYF